MKFNISTTKEFCLKTENTPGMLYKISSLLGEHGVNVNSISAFIQGNEAIFRIITNDIETTNKLIEKIDGLIKFNLGDILVVKLNNKPGELAKVTQILNKNRIHLESVYIINTKDLTEVALKPTDLKKAIEILG